MKLVKKLKGVYTVELKKAEYYNVDKLIKYLKDKKTHTDLCIKLWKKFTDENEEINWQDEYNSWHSTWKNKTTGDATELYREPKGPSFPIFEP
jgi:hypothetical protein